MGRRDSEVLRKMERWQREAQRDPEKETERWRETGRDRETQRQQKEILKTKDWREQTERETGEEETH